MAVEHPLVSGLRWILEHRRQPSGEPWNPSAFGDVALGNRSHVGLILSGKIDPANVKWGTVEKLAAAGQVSAAWLQTGQGERELASQVDRYPEREDAIAEYDNLPEDVLLEVRSMRFHSGSRPTKARWKSYIDATLLAKAKGERLGSPLPDDDDRPPEARRGKEGKR